MSQYLAFALIGLGVGSFYAALATGLVVTYRGTGIINFAAGAMATWSVYVFDELRKTGDLILPVVVVPSRISLGTSMAIVPALGLGVASAIALGVATHVLVFRPLRTAPVLAKVVATVGVMIVSQALIVLNFGGSPRQVGPILPTRIIAIGGVNVPSDRLLAAAIVVGVAAAVGAYFRSTRLGLATLAGAENERAIASARFSPDVLAALTWALASAATAVTLIAASPFTVMSPVVFTSAIVPALAAVMLARLRSLPFAVVTGLALGSLNSMLTFSATKAWWPGWARIGIQEAAQFLVLIVVLFVVGDSLPTRGAAKTDPLPSVHRPQNRPLVVAAVSAVGLAALVFTSGSYRFGVITSLIMAIIALSLIVLTGLLGQISLAQAAFAGTAGFALSKLLAATSIPFPLTPIIAAGLAGLLGVVVGLPALRIRGAHLAVVTLGLAVAVERFVFRNPAITSADGNRISDPSLFGLDLGVRSGRTIARLDFGLLVLVVTVIVFVAVGNIARGATGRRFLAVRSDERAAAGLGVNVAGTKLVGFAIASFLAGIGGTLIGYSRGQLSASSFTVFVGLSILTFAYLGGMTSLSGALVAGGFAPLGIGYVVLDRSLDLGQWYLLLSGVGLVLTAIFNPEGIAGANRKLIERLTRKIRGETIALGGQAEASVEVDLAFGRAAVQANRRLPPTPEVVLTTQALSVSYSGIRAVDDVDLVVHRNEIVGLIGANGAGKTSLLDAIGGFVPCAGRVELQSASVDGLRSHRRAELGMARTWQAMQLFRDLTVGDNIRLGAERTSRWSPLVDAVRPQPEAEAATVADVLQLLGLASAAQLYPHQLSLGRQKLVGLGRAIASDPKVVLLDEPAAGLDETARHRMARRVIDIVNRGTSVLVIDHDMNFVFDVCDRVYVLDFGRVIAHGTPADIRGDRTVIDAYLGADQRVDENTDVDLGFDAEVTGG